MPIIGITMVFIRKKKVGDNTYLVKVESYRNKGKVKQRIIQYLGKEIDGKPVKKVFADKIEVTGVKQSLDVLAIDKIVEDLDLKSLRNPYVLALIYSQLLENKSINKLENWMRFTEIPSILGIENISIKKLYESLSDINEDDFEKLDKNMNAIFSKYEKIWKEISNMLLKNQ